MYRNVTCIIVDMLMLHVCYFKLLGYDLMILSFSLQRHPDKNDDPEAQEMFIKINEAHEVE